MWRCLAVAAVCVFTLFGCAAPAPKLGPPPTPFIATRAPRQVAPVRPIDRGPEAPPDKHAQSGAGRAVPHDQALRGRTIVVDAGHGGKDPGAPGRAAGVPEKTINLEIAQHLAACLRDRGARVVMTRDGDRFIELDTRAAIAQRERCDMFISIHANSSPKSNVTGIAAHIARGTGGQSLKAANHIGAALRAAGLHFNGVNGNAFKVLINHSRPAILIECGYLTNRAEAQRLATAGYRAQIAEAIADGLVAHFTQ
jgi:N-acetylmuramoyl-L-alanine amidase